MCSSTGRIPSLEPVMLGGMGLVEGGGLPDQLSERGAVDLILGPKVDRSTGVPRQSRVEQMMGVREEGSLGEGQIDDLLGGLTGLPVPGSVP